MERSFIESDWVVLKMDIEGAEHDVVPALLRSERARRLIDVFLWECHETTGAQSCNTLASRMKRASPWIHHMTTHYPETDADSARERVLLAEHLRKARAGKAH
jgi:hypothetical protein